MVANLRNVDEDLAQKVADLLGFDDLPERSEPAAEPHTGLAPSPALSIVLNGPDRFEGRKIGVLVSDGADASVIEMLEAEANNDGVMVEFVAPTVGGVTAGDGTPGRGAAEGRRRPVGALRRGRDRGVGGRGTGAGRGSGGP